MAALGAEIDGIVWAGGAQVTLVSFVIPNYNHAQYLGDAIRSALAQSHAPIEIIVVDDGSTDDSLAVAEQFGSQIRLVRQPNSGLSAARNSGIQVATGDYIALLDADDLVEPVYCERLLAALAASPDADGAYCGYRFVDQNNQPLPRAERRVLAPEHLYASMLNGNYWVPESLLLRRACYLAAGEFDPSLRACEDWDVWLRFSRQYNLIGIADVLIRYRVVVGSMSSNPRRMLDNRLAVLRKHLGEPPVQAGGSAAHHAYANAYLRSAIEYFQAGDAHGGYVCLRDATHLLPQMLEQRSIYYELACSGQDRGSQGYAAQLDLEQQQVILFDLIDRLAHEAGLPSDAGLVRSWRAQALWALAQLHYQAGAVDRSRAAWWQARSLDGRLLRRRAFLAFGARTLAGPRQIARLKRLAGAAPARVD